MPEGLSASEVGKEIGEHAHHAETDAKHTGRARMISITEALLLSAVAIIAAWSGYSAAKWGTESSLHLAKASATRTKANREFQQSLSLRTADAVGFNAWFGAYIAGNKNGARVAARRFRPQYEVAFRAWLATHPFTNPNAPKGPQFMPQYHPTGAAESVALDSEADSLYNQGERAAETGDKYVRATVILASVLFLVGISTHFPLPGVRIALITVATCLLIFGVIEILQLPGPPS
jgi:hypothetical protein